MKLILVIQSLICVIGGALLSYFYTPSHGASFFVGSFILTMSFSMLFIGYGLIFKKKMIALAISLIVFKYAILGIFIFTLVKLSWFEPLWFSMGVASFMLSAFIYALKVGSREGNDHVI